MAVEREHNQHQADYQELVAALSERFEKEGLLTELQPYQHWVVWRYESVNGRVKKPPFNPRTHYQETIPFRGQTERLLKKASSFCSARDYW